MTYTVQNHPWHDPVPATDFLDAVAVARQRGWEAAILLDGRLVATWTPGSGTKVHDRAKIEEAA